MLQDELYIEDLTR